jgi:hypothetical protein
MNPRSNKWSMDGVRSNPFSPLSRSSFVLRRQSSFAGHLAASRHLACSPSIRRCRGFRNGRMPSMAHRERILPKDCFCSDRSHRSPESKRPAFGWSLISSGECNLLVRPRSLQRQAGRNGSGTKMCLGVHQSGQELSGKST